MNGPLLRDQGLANAVTCDEAGPNASLNAKSRCQEPLDASGTLTRFTPISLAEADKTALMDRRDRKYVVDADVLPSLLDGLSAQYAVLEAGGTPLQQYRTVYFDTPGFSFYLDHHRGRPSRLKVRRRTYLSTEASFLEVKRRLTSGQTSKVRVASCGRRSGLETDELDWLDESPGIAGCALEPVLVNRFTRVTLVSKDRAERVTIDTCLRFRTDRDHQALPQTAIVEVKDGGCGRSVVGERLRALGVRPTTFSKYCVGLALLTPELKQNAFKRSLNDAQNPPRSRIHVC